MRPVQVDATVRKSGTRAQMARWTSLWTTCGHVRSTMCAGLCTACVCRLGTVQWDIREQVKTDPHGVEKKYFAPLHLKFMAVCRFLSGQGIAVSYRNAHAPAVGYPERGMTCAIQAIRTTPAYVPHPAAVGHDRRITT